MGDNYSDVLIESTLNKIRALVKENKTLRKSNRNWRRKCQRLRHELKDVKENG